MHYVPFLDYVLSRFSHEFILSLRCVRHKRLLLQVVVCREDLRLEVRKVFPDRRLSPLNEVLDLKYVSLLRMSECCLRGSCEQLLSFCYEVL